MATSTRERRTRGAAKSLPALNTTVNHPTKTKIDAIADAIGISQGRALDLILASIEVDANGRPAFYTGPLAHDEHQELPLASSA